MGCTIAAVAFIASAALQDDDDNGNRVDTDASVNLGYRSESLAVDSPLLLNHLMSDWILTFSLFY